MAKISNVNFFKEKISANKTAPVIGSRDEKVKNVGGISMERPLKLSPNAERSLNRLAALLNETKQKELADRVKRLRQSYERRYFTVAVAGEFSRGKSTFINRLLETDALPVGNLPTTALLTKIRYNDNNCLAVFNYAGKREKILPLQEESWQGLTANHNGKDYDGIALVGLRSDWLKRTGIEVEDTPGAGDLSGKRAALTDEALMSDDGAIIAVSATQPISRSESLFIEQRLLSGKIPFLMVIITKLDLVPQSERAAVVEYVKNRVAQWKRDIPVFIPYEIDVDGEYGDIMGMDKIKSCIESWISSPDRIALNELSLMSRIKDIADIALDSLEQQKQLLQTDEEKRLQLIEEKKNKLNGERIVWNDLKIGMLERCGMCKEVLAQRISEGADRIIERLQIEVSHCNDVKRWAENDYAYRLKSELMNMSVSVENSVSRVISSDARWFNDALARRYKIQVSFDKQNLADDDVVRDFEVEQMELKDMAISRNITRIGTTVLSLAGYTLFASLGIMPIIATMGIGTGASIISESVFKKKIEEQRGEMCKSITKSVQSVADEFAEQANEKVNEMYNSIIDSAVEREESWLAAQNTAVENSVQSKDPAAIERLEGNINELKAIKGCAN